MLNVAKLLDKLNIVYFSYDSKNRVIIPDKKYANNAMYNEFIKITYHLSKKRVIFDVLKDKSIILSTKRRFYRPSLLLSEIKKRYKNKSIFIVSNTKVEGITNLPLNKIIHFDVEVDASNYDALLLTSKNAVEALTKTDNNWKEIPFYVISEETAKLVKDMGAKVAYFSRFHHGVEFAKELESRLQEKRVLYLRGEEVACDMEKVLREKGIECDSKVVYKNEFLKNADLPKLPKAAKIIFPSPSSIKHFLKAYSWEKGFKAICIGKTTLSSLPENIKGHMAEKTSFESCKDKAREI